MDPKPVQGKMMFQSAPNVAATEATLGDRDFERVAARIHRMAGIVLEPQKRQMIHARLSRRLRARDMSDFGVYLDHLDTERDSVEMQEFVNAITTNLTSFFREAHHFDHFDTQVLSPALSAQAKTLRIWSAGCSTGEEAYSIALTVLSRTDVPPPDFKILATDLDTNVLEKARQGIYAHDKVSTVLVAHAKQTINTAGGEGVQMSKKARGLVTFRQLNLLQSWPMRGSFDAIFCRNVMIYFDSETKYSLINRFCEQLKPGGYLYLGHSESILGENTRFSSEGKTIYKRLQG